MFIGKKVFIVTAVALVFLGCAKKEGGVDGSGGNVTVSEYDYFEYSVSLQKYQIRDVLHRLKLFQKFNSGFLGPNEVLVNRLLGDNPDQTLELLEQTDIYGQSKLCKSRNHGRGDGAVINGKICLSYEALKRFKPGEIEREMTILTLHEFSHLRGFNEEEAVRLQESLTRNFESAILVENHEYQGLRELLKRQVFYLHLALEEFLRQRVDWRPGMCRSLANAYGLDLEILYKKTKLPVFYQDEIEKVADRLGELSYDCLTLTLKELVEKFDLLFADVDTLHRELSYYEFPVCKGDLCRGSKIGYGADWMLLKSRASVLKGGPALPMTAVARVRCRVLDGVSGEEIPGKGTNGNKWRFGKEGRVYFILESEASDAMGDGQRGSEVFVKIHLAGEFHAESRDGFDFHRTFEKFRGILQEGVKEKISAELGVVTESPPLFKGKYLERGTWLFVDPFYGPIKAPPEYLQTVRIECGLN